MKQITDSLLRLTKEGKSSGGLKIDRIYTSYEVQFTLSLLEATRSDRGQTQVEKVW